LLCHHAFPPGLHYFYLYLKQHIEQKHRLDCERADAQILTVPLLDKINDYISRADVIIADCSKRNPNVFYELGIAHAHGKEVILVTGDPISEAPSDVRHFEFIHYELNKHVEFFDRLDNALRNVFRDRYEGLFNSAMRIFRDFKAATRAHVTAVDKDMFIQRLAEAEQTRDLPDLEDAKGVTEFVLPKIIAENSDLDTMRVITEWIVGKFEGTISSSPNQTA
jgi:hypothetical protein